MSKTVTVRKTFAQIALLVTAIFLTEHLSRYSADSAAFVAMAAMPYVDCRAQIVEKLPDGTQRIIEVGEDVTMSESGTPSNPVPDRAIPAGNCKVNVIGADGHSKGEFITSTLGSGPAPQPPVDGPLEFEVPGPIDPRSLQMLDPSYREDLQPLTNLPRSEILDQVFNDPVPQEQYQWTPQALEINPVSELNPTPEPIGNAISSEQIVNYEPVEITSEPPNLDSHKTYDVVGSTNSTFDTDDAREVGIIPIDQEAPDDISDLSENLNGEWVRDADTPEFMTRIRENIERVSERAEYLRHLQESGICSSECAGGRIFFENQERVLRSLEDFVYHGTPEIVSSTEIQPWERLPQSISPVEYYLRYTDATGSTFYCDSNGSCNSSESFSYQPLKVSPITLSEVPREMVFAAIQAQSFNGGSTSYALIELEASAQQSFYELTRPVFRDLPRCSLLTTLFVSQCSGWYSF